MADYLILIPLGLFVGTLGTLIGAGGGFLLVPILLLLYPLQQAATIASISLAVVFMNAASGSLAYIRMGRVDFKSGWLFAAATVPGAILGAITTENLNRRTFDIIFGVIMVIISTFLILRNKTKPPTQEAEKRGASRTIIEKDGTMHHYSFNPAVGVGTSLGVGYLSSLLGIGGGIIHVPVLVRLLRFPVHIATATSHFVLAIMALAGTLVHIYEGTFTKESAMQTMLIGIGVIVGAQLGAKLSSRVHGKWIIISLALAIGSVGVRILIGAL